MRPPPKSTLFPYPTLFRSPRSRRCRRRHIRQGTSPRDSEMCPAGYRSEEHTSEIQSRGLISYAVFFFKRCGPPRNLLFFPTRRSSDLLVRVGAVGGISGRAHLGGTRRCALPDIDRKSTRLKSSHADLSPMPFFFLKDAAPPEIYSFSLPDALPISSFASVPSEAYPAGHISEGLGDVPCRI